MSIVSRMDFLGLQAFVAIADRGSFREAAQHLHLSHTAISHRIRKLEDEVGQKLFMRSSKEVSLTQAGLELLPKIKEMLAVLAATIDDLKLSGNARRERIAIGCLPTFAAGRLPEILKSFSAANSDVVVHIFDKSAAEISDLLAKGLIEFGITIITTNRWDFDAEVLVEDPFVLVAPSDHALAQSKAIKWQDLEGFPLIRVSQHSGNRLIIDDALAGSEFDLSWQFEAQHLQTAISMARAGAALAVVPRMAFDATADTALSLQVLTEPNVSRDIGIITRKSGSLSANAERLRDLIRQSFNYLGDV